jgi:hypothetical protein
MIRFQCKCRKHLKAPEELTGRVVRCTRCQKRLQVLSIPAANANPVLATPAPSACHLPTGQRAVPTPTSFPPLAAPRGNIGDIQGFRAEPIHGLNCQERAP